MIWIPLESQQKKNMTREHLRTEKAPPLLPAPAACERSESADWADVSSSIDLTIHCSPTSLHATLRNMPCWLLILSDEFLFCLCFKGAVNDSKAIHCSKTKNNPGFRRSPLLRKWKTIKWCWPHHTTLRSIMGFMNKWMREWFETQLPYASHSIKNLSCQVCQWYIIIAW